LPKRGEEVFDSRSEASRRQLLKRMFE